MNKKTNSRILAILGYEGLYGGERANLKVLKMLRAGGAHIECIVVKDGGELLKKALQEEGFTYHAAAFGPSLFGLSGNLLHYMKNLIGMIRVSSKVVSTARKMQPTHFYVPNYIQFLYVWLGLLCFRRPTIHRLGDPPENNALHRFMWKKIIAPRVSMFVANSHYTLERLFKNDINRNQGQVINNCLTRAQNEESDLENSTNANERIMIYAGQINAQKGVDLIVNAAVKLCKKYDDIVFHFWGTVNYDSDFAKDMCKVIEDNNMQDRIVFCGYGKNIFSKFKEAYLHLCPSVQQESSANVVIEAKCAGIPTLVFPNGGLPELIEHKQDGYICEKPDTENLYKGIDYFLEDRERQQSACKSALDSAKSYSEDIIQDKWLNVLK